MTQPTNLEAFKQAAREKWDNLQKNRTDRPSRQETHELSDEIVTSTYLQAVKDIVNEIDSTRWGFGGLTPSSRQDLYDRLTEIEQKILQSLKQTKE